MSMRTDLDAKPDGRSMSSIDVSVNGVRVDLGAALHDARPVTFGGLKMKLSMDATTPVGKLWTTIIHVDCTPHLAHASQTREAP